MRWKFDCPCGLQRLLPQGLRFWQKVTLVPCAKCGMAPTFRFLGFGLWRLK